MLLDLISTTPYVQIGFLASIVAIVMASFAHNGSKQKAKLDFIDRPAVRAHELAMEIAKHGDQNKNGRRKC